MSIVLIVYDFDGVMTDNKVYVDQNGRETVQVNRGDGLGVSEIKKLGINQVIVSTEKNPVVQMRAKKLGIESFNGIDNKLACVEEISRTKNIPMRKICFIGNDINDLEVMTAVGLKICPADARGEIINIADLVLESKGGHGVIRELFDILTQTVTTK